MFTLRNGWAAAAMAALLTGCGSGSGDDEWRSVAGAAMPAVVTVTRAEGERAAPSKNGASNGSGFVFDERGYVLTNSHVVGGADSVLVRFHDGTTAAAEVVDDQPWVDLAVLRVDVSSPLPALAFAPSASLHVGDPVAAIGSPLGYSFSMTRGIVSGFDRTYTEQDAVGFVQHDASLNPGNSGGPLLDLHGRVVGVNTAGAAESIFDIGISLAVPAELAERYAAAVVANGRYEHAFLGVRVRTVTETIADVLGLETSGGVLVEHVSADGPAARAGLIVGDLLLGIGDDEIRSPRRLGQTLWRIRPGATVQVRLLRDSVAREVGVTLGRADRTAERRFGSDQSVVKLDARVEEAFGIETEDARQEARRSGVRIARVAPDSAAARNGLGPGDWLLMLNGTHVTTAAEARAVLEDADTYTVVALVARDGAEQQYVVLSRRPETLRSMPDVGASF